MIQGFVMRVSQSFSKMLSTPKSGLRIEINPGPREVTRYIVEGLAEPFNQIVCFSCQIPCN